MAPLEERASVALEVLYEREDLDELIIAQTAKLPPEKVIVPAEELPSPQAIVAV